MWLFRILSHLVVECAQSCYLLRLERARGSMLQICCFTAGAPDWLVAEGVRQCAVHPNERAAGTSAAGNTGEVYIECRFLHNLRLHQTCDIIAESCMCMQHADALDVQQPSIPGFAGAASGYEAMASDGSPGDHSQHKLIRHTFPHHLSPAKRQANSSPTLYHVDQEAAMTPAYAGQDHSAAHLFGSNNGQSRTFG